MYNNDTNIDYAENPRREQLLSANRDSLTLFSFKKRLEHLFCKKYRSGLNDYLRVTPREIIENNKLNRRFEYIQACGMDYTKSSFRRAEKQVELFKEEGKLNELYEFTY